MKGPQELCGILTTANGMKLGLCQLMRGPPDVGHPPFLTGQLILAPSSDLSGLPLPILTAGYRHSVETSPVPFHSVLPGFL